METEKGNKTDLSAVRLLVRVFPVLLSRLFLFPFFTSSLFIYVGDLSYTIVGIDALLRAVCCIFDFCSLAPLLLSLPIVRYGTSRTSGEHVALRDAHRRTGP